MLINDFVVNNWFFSQICNSVFLDPHLNMVEIDGEYKIILEIFSKIHRFKGTFDVIINQKNLFKFWKCINDVEYCQFYVLSTIWISFLDCIKAQNEKLFKFNFWTHFGSFGRFWSQRVMLRRWVLISRVPM